MPTRVAFTNCMRMRRKRIKVDAVQVRFSKGEVRASYSEADDRPSLKLRKKATIAALKHTLEALENGKVEDGGMSGFAGGFWDLCVDFPDDDKSPANDV